MVDYFFPLFSHIPQSHLVSRATPALCAPKEFRPFLHGGKSVCVTHDRRRCSRTGYPKRGFSHTT
jgi:hypothetical protein